MFVRWMGGLVSSFSVCDSMGDAGMFGGFISVKFWDSWMYVSKPPPSALGRSVRIGV